MNISKKLNLFTKISYDRFYFKTDTDMFLNNIENILFYVLFQRTIPMRHKEVHVINVHPSVKYALDFGLGLVSNKIKNRIKVNLLENK